MSDRSPEPGTQQSLAEELAAIPYEPLLPIEKWLIAVSLILGIALLGILSWASATYFPVTPPPPISGLQTTTSTSR